MLWNVNMINKYECREHGLHICTRINTVEGMFLCIFIWGTYSPVVPKLFSQNSEYKKLDRSLFHGT